MIPPASADRSSLQAMVQAVIMMDITGSEAVLMM